MNTKIMKELMSVYGTHASKSTAVKKWAGCFQSGKESVGNDARAGRPATACNVHNVEKVKREIEDCQKIIRYVPDRTNISRASVHKILQQNLKMKKVCSMLVFNVLTPEQKKERFFIAETLLERLRGRSDAS